MTYTQTKPIRRRGSKTAVERHVYSGPMGDGYIDIEYRIQGGFVQRREFEHHGPEDRKLRTGWKFEKRPHLISVPEDETVRRVIDEDISYEDALKPRVR